VIDGELIISVDGTLSFEHLLARMNPSPKSVNELARKQPTVFLIFDILVADDGEVLVNHPLKDRRVRLEAFADSFLSSSARIQITPAIKTTREAQ